MPWQLEMRNTPDLSEAIFPALKCDARPCHSELPAAAAMVGSWGSCGIAPCSSGTLPGLLKKYEAPASHEGMYFVKPRCASRTARINALFRLSSVFTVSGAVAGP